MRIISSCILTLLLLAVLFYSCGGSQRADDAGEHDPVVTDAHPQPQKQTHQDEGDMLLGKPNCPQPNLKIDVALNKKFCGSEECLIEFAGYVWWTNFHFQGHQNWWWSNDQGSSFSPRLATLSGDGIHLKVAKDDLGGGSEWMASEVVALYKTGSRELVNFGYGTYLVSAKVVSGSTSWAKLDKNVSFGVFTYDNSTPSNSIKNTRRELDLAEVSTWGGCENVLNQALCVGNAQFALQPWDGLPDAKNVHRYSINDNKKEITLVMVWNGPNQPVTFSQYDGKHTLSNLPKKASNTWTTSSDQNPFIPDNGCQRFHINLWMGNYGQGEKHPGPSNGQEQEVVVTNFIYQPK